MNHIMPISYNEPHNANIIKQYHITISYNESHNADKIISYNESYKADIIKQYHIMNHTMQLLTINYESVYDMILWSGFLSLILISFFINLL